MRGSGPAPTRRDRPAYRSRQFSLPALTPRFALGRPATCASPRRLASALSAARLVPAGDETPPRGRAHLYAPTPGHLWRSSATARRCRICLAVRRSCLNEVCLPNFASRSARSGDSVNNDPMPECPMSATSARCGEDLETTASRPPPSQRQALGTRVEDERCRRCSRWSIGTTHRYRAVAVSIAPPPSPPPSRPVALVAPDNPRSRSTRHGTARTRRR